MDQQTLFEEIIARGFEEGIMTRDAYADLVETIIEEHRAMAVAGESQIDEDNNLEGLEDQLGARFDEYLVRLKDVQA